MSLSQLAEEFYTLRNKKEEIQSSLEEVNKQIESVEKALLEELGEQGLNRIDLPDKGSFSIFTRKFFSTEDKEALLSFLREQDAEDLLSVNHQTLNAYVNELKTRYGDDFVVPGVREASKSQIRMHRSK